MKETINLPNRCGGTLWLEKTKHIRENIYEWTLKVDDEHSWIFNHMGIIEPLCIIAVDPPGGPFIGVGDEFDNNYKIIFIQDATTFWISERNNNRENYFNGE